MELEGVVHHGVIVPDDATALPEGVRVRIIPTLLEQPKRWPEDVAAIYQELAEQDRRLAESMFPAVRETWPENEDSD